MNVFSQHHRFHDDNFPTESKQRIAYNFSRAAEQYDQADRLQRRVAQRLMLCLPETSGNLLDLGCGTGKWTQALSERYVQASVTGMDFAWGMLQKASRLDNKQIRWCAGDIEALPFVDNSMDLIFSSLSIQWCEQLDRVLKEAFRVLKPGGVFVFSTLAKGSLEEMREVWRTIDYESHTNEYLSFVEQEEICHYSKFSVQKLRCCSEVLYYNTVMNLLREFKSLGANTVTQTGQKGLMTPSKLQRFMLAYEQLRKTEGVPCSYNVIYSVLAKPH